MKRKVKKREIIKCAAIWEEEVDIPTYGVGAPNKNPMFLENRVYQGSSGKVYPLPVIDKIRDRKSDQPYTAVFLENEYLSVMVLPQLGGRIQRALDKTNEYDFVYYNEVIKPALVGLTGPWISGGIEFNWPQHHRPTTFSPVDWRRVRNADGSVAVELSEVDALYGTKAKMTIKLYADKAYIEITGKLYNPTDLPQSFLWWANPAMAVNDDTQTIFPPDVTAVYDHGKRDVSSFPIAKGVYYKHDYSAGVDISRYKNIPVPTSYMCAHSDYDFVGGYDYGKQAGILHVADHHISPGKKQWTWGCGDFGKAWDRNLTDNNGPYVELMTGVFSDNQPDFTWLKPMEEKTFTQYFMPYKEVGAVKNASREIVMNLEVADQTAQITVYATENFQNARVVLTAQSAPTTADGAKPGAPSKYEKLGAMANPTGDQAQTLYEKTVTISPTQVFTASVPIEVDPTQLTLSVYNANGRRMLSYTPRAQKTEPIPDPMEPAKPPEEIRTAEELYLTGLHLEQYRHATFLPDPYYLEALRRDPGDSRANTAYGRLLLRRGLFAESEPYFRAAIARTTQHNPNPYNAEAYLNLGLSLQYQGKTDAAYEAFYKATWSAETQELGFYWLAAIDARRKDYPLALEHIEKCLLKNAHNTKARALKGMLLRLLDRNQEAAVWLKENLDLDAFDYASHLTYGDTKTALSMMGERESSYINCAIDFAQAGFYQKAVETLELCPNPGPMIYYHLALYNAQVDYPSTVERNLKTAARADASYCFPNRLADIAALEFAIEHNPKDAKAPYYLGCLYYDRRVYDRAIALWEQSAALDPTFPTVWRNLALGYYNKRGEKDKALQCLEKAYALNERDARVLYELDGLYRKLGRSVQERFAFLDAHKKIALTRDDLYIEYVTLLNDLGRYQEAYDLIKAHQFHPWEGGEGKVTGQYATALTQLALQKMAAGDAETAKDLLQKALRFPRNLGEGKLEGAKDNNIYYYLGLAEQKLGNSQKATAYFTRAAAGDEEPANPMYYNDQPADMILFEGLAARALGDAARAEDKFQKLVHYGEEHENDHVKMDYFAVSLPDLQLWDEDLDVRNRIHCTYLIALGSLGLGDTPRAQKAFADVLRLDPSHQGAILYGGSIDRA